MGSRFYLQEPTLLKIVSIGGNKMTVKSVIGAKTSIHSKRIWRFVIYAPITNFKDHFAATLARLKCINDTYI